MSKEIFISSTPHETRLAIVEDEALTEIYYERENEYTLAGSIYNGRVTRVLPGMQSSFVEIGLERDAFLYITDFMEEAPDSEEFDTTPAGDRAARAPRLQRRATGEAGGRGERAGEDGAGTRDRDRNRDRQIAPVQPRNSRTALRGDDRIQRLRRFSASRVQRRFRLAKALPAPMAGAAGADAADARRGREPPAGRRRGGRQARPCRELRAGLLRSTAVPTTTLRLQPESSLEFDGEVSAQSPLQPPAVANARALAQRPRKTRQRTLPRRSATRRTTARSAATTFPRGFEPTRNLYGVDSGEPSGTGPIANAYPDEFEAGAEPVILPGESLSKYRKGGEEQAAPKPSASDTGYARPAGQPIHPCGRLGRRFRSARRDAFTTRRGGLAIRLGPRSRQTRARDATGLRATLSGKPRRDGHRDRDDRGRKPRRTAQRCSYCCC